MSIINKRWIYLVMCVTTFLFVGIAYAFSLFIPAIEQDLQFTRTETSLAFTINYIFFALGSLVTGFLMSKVSTKVLFRIGAILIGVGFYGSTCVTQAWEFYLCYSVCCGFAVGLTYNIGISIIPLYFQGKTGFITGILLMGYAMSTTIFGNSINYGLDNYGWKSVFLIFAAVIPIFLIIDSFLLKKPSKKQLTILPIAIHKKSNHREIPPQEVIRKKTFLIFLLIYILIGGIGLALINHAIITMQEDLKMLIPFSVIVISFISMFNGIGRILFGWLYDKIGGTHIFQILCIITMISTISIVLSLSTNCTALFIIGTSLIFLTYGGNASLAPIVLRSLFGDKYFSMNFAVTNIGTVILSIFSTLVGVIQVNTHGYLVPYVMLTLVAFCALVLSFIYIKVIKLEDL